MLSAGTPTFAQEPVLVLEEDLECLRAHADEYLALEQENLLVFLSFCPNVSPTPEELVALTENTGQAEEADGIKRMLVLTPNQIRCLAAGPTGVATPVGGERSAATQNVVELNLSACE